MIIYQEFASN